MPDDRVQHEQRGYAGGGPLTISAERDGDGHAHAGWGEGGMYVTVSDARRLAAVLRQASDVASRDSSDGRP